MATLTNISTYGSFSDNCEIVAVGRYENGACLDEVINNNFASKEQAVESIDEWAKSVGAEVEEVTFVRKSSL